MNNTKSNRIGVVFDFDDTLLPDSTTAAVAAVGLDVGDFWGLSLIHI